MKATTFLVSYQPYPARAEHCTIGVLVFAEKDKVQLFLAHNLKKVKALDPQSNIKSLRASLNEMVKEINYKPTSWEVFKNGKSGLRFSQESGVFSYTKIDEFERQVQWLLQTTAEPRGTYVRQLRQSLSSKAVERKSTFKN